MKRFRIWNLAAIAAILILSACASVKRPPSAGDFSDTTVFISGVPADQLDAVRFRQKLSELIDIDLITEDGRAKVQRLLENIEKRIVTGAEVPDALKSIGGFHARLLIRAALSPVNAVETQKLSGKIRRYIFNEYTLAGYLEVDTTVETYVNGAPAGKDEYWWSIAVLPGTYTVVPRVDSNLRDPFPGTILLPNAALDPQNPMGIWKRGLDHKLFAKGDSIVVLAASKNGLLIPKNDPIYQTDADSCIDLLFNGRPPEQSLPPQSAYCLGRCKNPPIINTK